MPLHTNFLFNKDLCLDNWSGYHSITGYWVSYNLLYYYILDIEITNQQMLYPDQHQIALSSCFFFYFVTISIQKLKNSAKTQNTIKKMWKKWKKNQNIMCAISET